MNIGKLSEKILNSGNRISYLLIFLLFGVLLMVFPNDSGEERNELSADVMDFSVEKEEARLEEIISTIEGVGKCKVLLSIHNGAEKVLAEDEGDTVVLSNSGKQTTVTVQTKFPEFHGAIIVSGGCENANVRYDILSSVMAYTGLSVERITICSIQQ